MGRRDNDAIAFAEEADADQAMRRLLEGYGQPSAVVPPADLATRVLAHLPNYPPSMAYAITQQKRRRQVWLGSLLVIVLVSLLSLGIWGVFGDSGGPASLAYGITSKLGEFLLVLVLAAKPLVHLILSPGALVVAGVLLMIPGAVWLWWYMLQRAPLVHTARSGL